MGRSQETFNKKEVNKRKEKKRKDKEKRRLERKEGEKKSSLDDMMAYVDENGNIIDEPMDPSTKEKVDIEEIEISIPRRDTSRDDDPIREGIVSFFNDSKGYGFIKDSVSRQDVFVHINNVIDEIKEGNKVSFEMEKGRKGFTAVNVKVVK